MNFFKRYKKIFLILGFLAFCALLGWLIWMTFFKPTIERPPGIDDELWEIIRTLPEAERAEFEQLLGDPSWLPGLADIDPGITIDPTRPDPTLMLDDPDPIASGGITKTELEVFRPTLRPTIDGQGNISYFDLRDNKFYRLDKDGNIITISDQIFEKAIDITWAPNADKAIIKNYDSSKILYNFDTKRQIALPNHWDDFSFSPDGSQITSKSLGNTADNRWLITFNDEGSSAQILEKIGDNHDKVYPNWSPNNQMVAMWTRGIDFNRQDVFFVGLNNENFRSTTIEGRGFQPQWSNTGERLLYSVYHTDTDMNPTLWVVNSSPDSIGQNRTRLNISTWAEKCTFVGNDDVYCAVPDYLPPGSGLFPEAADESIDSLYHINLKTNEKNLIAIPDRPTNISQIMVTSEKDKLFFTDKFTGQLYSINLR